MSQEIIAGNGSGILRARSWRRSPGLATAIGVTVALVMTGCGGRATDHEGAAAPAKGNAAASAQPAAASPDQSTPQPSTAPAADPGTGAAPAATPAASPQAATPGGPATPAAASNAAAATPAKGPGTATAAGTRPAAGGTTPAPDKPGAVPAPPVPAPPGGGPHTGPANLSPVNVGSICECSGPAGASVGPGIASNQLVVKWINDNGGLNGHPIKLFVADSNSDPNRYFSLVKQMVESDKVIAFMGQMAPLTVNAADKYLRDKQIPVVGGDGAHGLWFQSPVLFFPGPSYTTQAVGTAKLAVALNTPKVAMFYCAEAQPCQVGRDALHSKLKDEKAPDAQIVYEAKVSLAQPDFSAECLQAKSKGAQAVIVFVDAAAASRATRSCIQQGFRPQWLTSPLTSAHADDPNNDGMTNPVAVFPWFAEDTPAERLFHDVVRRYNPSLTVNATTSVVWVAGQMLLAASKNLPADNPTAADIMKGMWTIRNTTFDGLLPDPVSFTAGQPSPDHPCYFVVQIKNGTYTAPQGSKPQCL
jgi:branched-chain amino acid transport system substrate-binding protein